MRKDGHGFLTSLISIIDSDEKRWTWIFDISNIDYRL